MTIYKNNLNSLVSLLLLSLFIIPVVSSAAGLVPCDGVTVKCDFNAFIGMINNIISWFISIAGVIFAISFIRGGFLWILSGESPGKKEEAKKVLWNTLLGFVIILVAWLIVYTILHVLAPNNTSVLQFIGNGK